MCQSLADPFYTRMVKLPFLSNNMLKIMQIYTFQQLFQFWSCKCKSYLICISIISHHTSCCDPATPLFFVPSQIPLLGHIKCKLLALIFMHFITYHNNFCLHCQLAGFPDKLFPAAIPASDGFSPIIHRAIPLSFKTILIPFLGLTSLMDKC